MASGAFRGHPERDPEYQKEMYRRAFAWIESNPATADKVIARYEYQPTIQQLKGFAKGVTGRANLTCNTETAIPWQFLAKAIIREWGKVNEDGD